MNLIKPKVKLSGNLQPALILILVGMEILYVGYMILKGLSALLGLDYHLLLNPLVLFSFLIYAIIIYAGICFFRGKTLGWYGVISLHIIIFLKNVLVFISVILVLLFKQSLLKNIHLPTFNMNPNVLQAIFELVISGIMIKFLFSPDTIMSYNLDRNTKLILIIKTAVVSVILVVLYLAISLLILKS